MMMRILTPIVFAFSLGLTPVLAAEKLVIKADPWCPYTCKAGSDQPGYMIEIAQAIFEPKGISVDYQETNWARAVQEARAGQTGAVAGAIVGDAPDFVFPKKNLGSDQSCFYVTKKNFWTYAGVHSLKGKTLGAIQDYHYGEPLDGYIEKNKADEKKIQLVSGETPLKSNLLKLAAQRIDAFVESSTVVSSYLKAHPEYADTVHATGCLKSAKLYIAFSPALPRSKELVKLFDQGVADLQKSGQLAKILAKYGVPKWK